MWKYYALLSAFFAALTAIFAKIGGKMSIRIWQQPFARLSLLSGDMADMIDNYDFLYTHIKNLKSKLARLGETDRLQNIYGMGYKWTEY